MRETKSAGMGLRTAPGSTPKRLAAFRPKMRAFHVAGERRITQALHQHLGHLESPQRLDLPAR